MIYNGGINCNSISFTYFSSYMILVYYKYTLIAKDSARLTDVNLLKKALELYQIDTWKYPTPVNSKEVKFIDTTVWTQWTIDKNIITNLERVNKVPKDPRYDVEYTYSLASNWLTYQIWSITESSKMTWKLIFNQANADTEANVWTFLYWNYNWISTLVKMDWWYVLYALPSIMLADIDWTTDLSQMWEWLIVISWDKCLPHSYKNYSDTCLVEFIPEILYIWSNLPLTQADVMSIIERLEVIYSAPWFENSPYQELKTNIVTKAISDSTYLSDEDSDNSTWSTSVSTTLSNILETNSLLNIEDDTLFYSLWSSIIWWVIENQVPEETYDLWEEVTEVWVEEYLETHWTWSLEILQYDPVNIELDTGETWIEFINVSIQDSSWNIECESCIEFSN